MSETPFYATKTTADFAEITKLLASAMEQARVVTVVLKKKDHLYHLEVAEASPEAM